MTRIWVAADVEDLEAAQLGEPVGSSVNRLSARWSSRSETNRPNSGGTLVRRFRATYSFRSATRSPASGGNDVRRLSSTSSVRSSRSEPMVAGHRRELVVVEIQLLEMEQRAQLGRQFGQPRALSTSRRTHRGSSSASATLRYTLPTDSGAHPGSGWRGFGSRSQPAGPGGTPRRSSRPRGPADACARGERHGQWAVRAAASGRTHPPITGRSSAGGAGTAGSARRPRAASCPARPTRSPPRPRSSSRRAV